MVKVEVDEGFGKITGSNENEWLIVPYWPCSGKTVRKMAPGKLPKAWVDEVAAFADAEYAAHSR